MNGVRRRAERPRLLYIAPVPPSPTAHGLAMRSAAVLQALTAHYRVSLLVVTLGPRRELPPLNPSITALCRGVRVLDSHQTRRVIAQSASGGPSGIFPQRRFSAVHIHRLATAWALRSWIERLPPTVHLSLDLDDIESLANQRMASIAEKRGNTGLAARLSDSAHAYVAQEEWALGSFDRIFVCSEIDASRLEQHGRATIRILPNTVATPADIPAPRRGSPFTFLFIGTFGHFPNVDAARFFCEEILPLLRAQAKSGVRVIFAGRRAGKALGPTLGDLRDVEIRPDVTDLASLYTEADAVIVPLRAGGGTRIKILEAFAHRRPVIATTIGAEGIAAEPGQHLLIADEPQSFADACAAVMNDAELAAALAVNGYRLHRVRYSAERLGQILESFESSITKAPPASEAPLAEASTLDPN